MTAKTKEEKRDLREKLTTKALQENLLPEGKNLLVTMIWNGKGEMRVTDLMELCNAPMAEISDGARCLSAAKINVSTGFDFVTLSKEYQQ